MSSKVKKSQSAKVNSKVDLNTRVDNQNETQGNSLYAELAGEGPGGVIIDATKEGTAEDWSPLQPEDGSDDAPSVIRTSKDLDSSSK